jgi:D-alanyl-D-alanine carboxypeptidase
MNKAMKNDIGRKLVIQSGYRSPAYQLFVFLFQLQANDWKAETTLKEVALPGYSEHAGDRQALDLRAKCFLGPIDTYDFHRTAEYRWLQKNAQRYNFALSYDKNNGSGTQFEPWHWRHQKSRP